MADADPTIHAALDAAVSALVELPDADRQQAPDVLERLETALAYSSVVMDATDPLLITAEWQAGLIREFEAIATDPTSAASDPQHVDDLLSVVTCLPAARGRDLEQAARDAAASYQRSLAQRITSLNAQVGGTKSNLLDLEQKLDAARGEFTDTVEKAATTLQERTDALAAAISQQQALLDQQLTRHTQAFDKSQSENSARVQEQLDAMSTQLEATAGDADEAVRKEVAKIETVAKDVGVLSSAIALKITADRYGDEADSQARIADWLRVGTVFVTLLAASAAVWAVERNSDDTHALVAKLAVSSALGALATYIATQSSRHRRREARSRELQLQLSAFSPFIAPLDPELQQLERVRMTRRTFGVWDTAATAHPDDDDDLGPTALGLVREILQRPKSDAADP
jgi:hypothetical protein